jgi:carbamoyltransferase
VTAAADEPPPEDRLYLGIMTGPHDPSAAAVRNGEVLALADEERFTRTKHAFGAYPINAVRYCLDAAGVDLAGVHQISMPWDLAAHTDGRIKAFYQGVAQQFDVDVATRRWQQRQLATFHLDNLRAWHGRELFHASGCTTVPPIVGPGHHYTHAFQAAFESPFDSCVALVLDGSGDTQSGTLWLRCGADLTLLREITLPHSLGWFYAAVTEYLGFESSDGEYKVMGLASHGRPDAHLDALVAHVVHPAEDGIGYRLDPRYVHYGPHTWSGRFTDHLATLFGRPPRARCQAVEQWHMDLAAAAQRALERAACRLVSWAVRETGAHDLCVGGGVGMNVKMNAAIAALPEVNRVFAHPGCADNGAAAGAALAACYADTGRLPRPLRTMALGPAYGRDDVLHALRTTGCRFVELDDPCDAVARDLADGLVVGWFSGRMEAGSRALGHRSILADPRSPGIRDRVNAVIKHREPWRPFAPSVPDETADAYSDEDRGDGRFMTMAFPANELMRQHAPAVVHVDGTSRIHRVVRADNPVFHRLIESFGNLTGVPVLLNTSFNVAGEPIVCTPTDALRTFWGSGLDVLVLENFVVRKADRATGMWSP